MSFLSDLRVWLEHSKNSHEAVNEIFSLLKGAGLQKTPFLIEFLDDGTVSVTLIRDEDHPHRHRTSPEDEADVKAIVSIFANAAAARGLAIKPGTKLDFGHQRGH